MPSKFKEIEYFKNTIENISDRQSRDDEHDDKLMELIDSSSDESSFDEHDDILMSYIDSSEDEMSTARNYSFPTQSDDDFINSVEFNWSHEEERHHTTLEQAPSHEFNLENNIELGRLDPLDCCSQCPFCKREDSFCEECVLSLIHI